MSNNNFYSLKKIWEKLKVYVECQYCCLQVTAADDGLWDISYPSVDWNSTDIVVMHCQDFLNVSDGVCRELKMIEQHFGDYSNRVIAVVCNFDLESVYSGPVNIIYFPTHSYNILTNLRENYNQWNQKLNNKRKHTYQSLNGVGKPHRVLTVELLEEFSNGIVCLNPSKPLTELDYSQYLNITNEENFMRLSHIYGECDINLVTETIYDYYPGIITEKSLFAWLAKQVPITIGYPGIVEHIRALGFDTFDDVVDNSYDLVNNDLRVNTAIELNCKLLSSGIDRIGLSERLQANQQHALTWPNRMIHEYESASRTIHQRLTMG